MAVNVAANEGGASSERLISSGGNIYTLYSGNVKTGLATRGRGFWTGVRRADEDNPDVDQPMATARVLAGDLEGNEDTSDDGFDDNKDPLQALHARHSVRQVAATQKKEARRLIEAASGHMFGLKSVQPTLTVGNVKVDLLLQDPDKLSKSELYDSALHVKALVDGGTFTARELEILQGYAGRIAKAIRGLIDAEHAVAKAILTKPSAERDEEERKSKQAKPQPKKAQKVEGDAKGKKQYKYPKKDDGKGPQSDGKKPGAADGPEHPDPAPNGHTVDAPPQIDPTEFCKRLGIAPVQVEKLAKKKTRHDFIAFFMQHADVADKHSITPVFLGRLYDSITYEGQPQAQQPQQKQAAKPPGGLKMTSAMGKSVVVFQGGTLDRETLAMIDLMRARKAQTVEDLRKCLQQYYATTEDESVRITRSLINSWENKGLVRLYPPRS